MVMLCYSKEDSFDFTQLLQEITPLPPNSATSFLCILKSLKRVFIPQLLTYYTLSSGLAFIMLFFFCLLNCFYCVVLWLSVLFDYTASWSTVVVFKMCFMNTLDWIIYSFECYSVFFFHSFSFNFCIELVC